MDCRRALIVALSLAAAGTAPAQGETDEAGALRKQLAEEFRAHREWRIDDFLARSALVERAVERNRDVAPRWAAGFCRSFASALARERPDDAMPWFDRAIEIARAGNLPLVAAQHALSKGEVLLEISRHDEVLTTVKGAEQIFEDRPEADLPARRGLVGVAMQRGRALLNLGREDEALAELDRARRLVTAIHSQTDNEYSGIAQVAINRGIALARTGRFADALREYEHARSVLAGLDAPVMLAMIDSNIANVNSTIGRTAEARAHYERAGPAYLRAGQPLLYARALTNLALACMNARDDAAAIPALDDAVAIFERAGDEARTADAQLLRAQALTRLGAHDSAHEALAAAREVFETRGLPQALGQLELSVAATLLSEARYDEALSALDRAASQFEIVGSPAEFAVMHALRGEALRLADVDDGQRALAEFARASAIVESATADLAALGNSASRMLRERFAAIAPQAADLALDLEQRPAAVSQSYAVTQALHGLGAADVFTRSASKGSPVTGELADALAAAERELRAAQRESRDVASAPARTTAELRGRTAALNRASSRSREAARALAALRERVRLVRMGEAAAATAASLADVQKALDPTTALIEFVASERSTHAYVITQDTARLVAFEEPRRVTAAVTDLADVLWRRQRPSPTELRRVGELALDPILAQLPAAVTTLLIAPRGELCRIPFGYLLTNEPAASSPEQPFLAQRYAIAYVPSGTAMVAMRGRPTPTQGGAQTFAGLANPTGQNAPLAHSTDEVASIASLFATADEREAVRARPLPNAVDGDRFTLLLRDRADELALRDPRIQNASIVHLACHAEADTVAPRLSRLLLSPTTGDGHLYLDELAELDLRCELLVLSSCASAVGPLSRVDGMIGLASAGLAAGAHAVLSTIWPVADDDAARFMLLFYEELLQGDGNRISALHAARRRAIGQGMPARAWAAFVLFDAGST